MTKKILEFGSGKEWDDWTKEEYKDYVVHCVDPTYRETSMNINVCKYSDNIIDFLRKCNDEKFDYIYSNNVIEHISHTQYQYLFYLLFLNSNVDAKMVIVTADMNKLAEEIKKINGNMTAFSFNKWYTKCNYAVYADDSPHVSIMTPDILKYHATSEGLWSFDKVKYINEEDPWEMTAIFTSNKKSVDECRPKNKETLLRS